MSIIVQKVNREITGMSKDLSKTVVTLRDRERTTTGLQVMFTRNYQQLASCKNISKQIMDKEPFVIIRKK